MDRTLRFRIVLRAPPAGVDFGVQEGRGASYRTIETQRSDGDDLRFEFSAAVRVTAPRAGVDTVDGIDFRGPVVQGPAGERFVYIDIGTCAGQTDTPWSRRLKVPLRGITRDIIDRASNQLHGVLETEVPGTGNDGGPTCATVKPFAGWKLIA